MSNHLLLTGVTGFVGKVVLAELLRRELGIERVTVLIRPTTSRDGTVVAPEERFNDVVNSPALSDVQPDVERGWQKRVQVIAADLEQNNCGMSHATIASLQTSITHVIHCAASVDFDLPIQEAASANIVSALNVLELARGCSRLIGMVDVSTAYVAVWRAGPIHETLAHLPRPADELFKAIQNNTRAQQELLSESGHPNTYTYTKCLAEHLLSERRGNVPLAIVRPSIICAAWQRPFPGWIDSAAAFAGCLLYTGLGVVKAWNADPATRVDVVPVDSVANRIVDVAFFERFPKLNEEVPIHIVAMGLQRAMRADMSAQSTAQYFRERPGAKSVSQLFVGRIEHGFRFADFKCRVLPLQTLRAFYALTFRTKLRRRIEKVNRKIRYLNSAFHYFTHHSFDFRPRVSVQAPNFTPRKYIEVVNRGIYRHLLKQDETQALFAGAVHDDARSDLRWMTNKPHGTIAIRLLGYLFRKTLRRCTSKVTFDRHSFERAVQAAPPNAIFVLTPSHRSYFDFLLTSYLCFQHPELGIPVPHIAAAEEFSRIPVVGRFLRQTQAFYIRRGVGKAVPEVGAELRRITARAASLMFFIEGQRSRDRRMLSPKRGLLRALQATGQTFAVLPVAIAYEQIPEQVAFDRELRGGERSKMSVRGILKWSLQLIANKVSLGQVHLTCAEPFVLNQSIDVPELADNITKRLQTQTIVTRFHLRSFLTHAALPNVDETWLAHAIEQRGGRVLDSDTALPAELSPVLLQSLQNQWMHWFYADALALFPHDPDIRSHIARHGWTGLHLKSAQAQPLDVRVESVVRALFHTLHRDYSLARAFVGQTRDITPTAALDIVKAHPEAYLPNLQDALVTLTTQGDVEKQIPHHIAEQATHSVVSA